jgi:hypothetical protein
MPEGSALKGSQLGGVGLAGVCVCCCTWAGSGDGLLLQVHSGVVSGFAYLSVCYRYKVSVCLSLSLSLTFALAE